MIRVSGNEVEVSGAPDAIMREFASLTQHVMLICSSKYDAKDVANEIVSVVSVISEDEK